jgi:hypothetical protein
MMAENMGDGVGAETIAEDWPRTWDEARDAVLSSPDDRDVMMRIAGKFPNLMRCCSPSLRADRDVVLKAVSVQGEVLSVVAEHLKGDRQIVLRAVAQNGTCLRFASDDAKADRQVVKVAAAQNRAALAFADRDLHADSKILDEVEHFIKAVEIMRRDPENLECVYAALEVDAMAIFDAPVACRADRGVVLFAVSRCGEALAFASDELKGDLEVVRVAVLHDALALLHASDTIKADIEMCMFAAAHDGRSLQYMDESVRALPYVVMTCFATHEHAKYYAPSKFVKDAALQEEALVLKECLEAVAAAPDSRVNVREQCGRHGFALSRASDRLRADREIVIAACGSKGLALMYAHHDLRNDWGVIMAAVTQTGFALRYATAKLKADHEIAYFAVLTDGASLKYTTEDIRATPDLVLLATASDPDAFEHASPDLPDAHSVLARAEVLRKSLASIKKSPRDREAVRNAVVVQGLSLYLASEELRADQQIVLNAVSQCGDSLLFASTGLRNDVKVVLTAVSQRGKALRFAGNDARANYEIVTAAVMNDGNALEIASPSLRCDRRVVLFACAQNGLALGFASRLLQRCREVAALAVAANPRAEALVPPMLKTDPGWSGIVQEMRRGFSVIKQDRQLRTAAEKLRAMVYYVLTNYPQDMRPPRTLKTEFHEHLDAMVNAAQIKKLTSMRRSSDLMIRTDLAPSLRPWEVADDYTNDQLWDYFKKVDIDGNGSVSFDELKEAFKAMGTHLTDAQVHDILLDADANGNNEIEFDEFNKVMNGF